MFTPLTFGIALLAAIIIPRIIGGPPLRLLAFIGLGAAAAYTGFVSLWGGILIALSPVIAAVLSMAYFFWLGRRALAGKMGKEQQWVAELVEANDEKFMQSMNQISRMQMKEIFVLADTKEELRQAVIEQASSDGKPDGV